MKLHARKPQKFSMLHLCSIKLQEHIKEFQLKSGFVMKKNGVQHYLKLLVLEISINSFGHVLREKVYFFHQKVCLFATIITLQEKESTTILKATSFTQFSEKHGFHR